MLENGLEVCPCKRKNCVRHSNCKECIEHHNSKKYVPYCKRNNLKKNNGKSI